jgi:hypothetical protein
MLEPFPADQGTAQRGERLMDIRPPFIPHQQALGAVQLDQRPFHHAAVAAQVLAGVGAQRAIQDGQ